MKLIKLIFISLLSNIAYQLSCPPGSVPAGEGCVSQCPPPNTLIENGKCVAQCSENYELLDNLFCCKEGELLHQGQCHPPVKCPPGSVNSGPFSCVSQCPPPNLFIENNECVLECSTNYIAFDIFCCKEGDIFDQIKGICTELICPPGSIKQGSGCVSQCPPPNIFIENGECVFECSQGYQVQENIFCCKEGQLFIEGECVDFICPPGSISVGPGACVSQCPPPNTFIENGECIEQCSEGFNIFDGIFCCKDNSFLDSSSGECIDCGIGGVQSGNGCVSRCPPPNTLIENGECVQECSEGFNILENLVCCPENHFLDTESGECIDCGIGGVQSGNGCVSRCPPPNTLIENGECVENCSEGFTLFENLVCCPENHFLDTESGECIDCGIGGVQSGNGCVSRCPPPNIYIQNDECVEQCSEGYHEDRFNFCCLNGYVLDSELGECVKCPLGSMQVDDDCIDICTPPTLIQNNSCVQQCSQGYYSILNTICCLDTQYLDESTGECKLCSLGEIGIGTSCSDKCDPPTSLIQGSECVSECSSGFNLIQDLFCCKPEEFLNLGIGKCDSCGPAGVGAGTGCVSKCPPPNIFIQEGDCVSECSQGFNLFDNIFCCEEGTAWTGQECLPTPIPPIEPPIQPPNSIDEFTQNCSDNLGELMDEQGNTLMDNQCIPFIENNEQRFQFLVNFINPYIFNDDCLDIQVLFEDVELNQGNSDLNEWSFDAVGQIISWNIRLEDFHSNLYQCTFIEEDDQFTWSCDYKVNILFMDSVQLCYSAKIMVTLDRIKEDELTINVQKNEVQGVCCENELSIETELRFCTSLACSDFLDSPLTVIRKEDFFVEHFISSPGFQNFYLSLVQVRLGEFLPVIVNSDVSSAGSIKLQLRSNVAKPGLILEVISLLEKTNPNNNGRRRRRRRYLKGYDESDIREDYKLKGFTDISIISDKDIGDLQKDINKNGKKIIDQNISFAQENDYLTVGLYVISGILGIIMFVGIGLICQRKTLKSTQKKMKGSVQDNDFEVQCTPSYQ